MNAAIYFQSDGYVLEGVQIMGRRMAGAAFLRAAVEGRDGEALAGFAPLEKSGDNFRAAVRAIDPAAEAVWIPSFRLDLLAQRRVLYRPDNVLGQHARLRLRAGPAAFSICGVTHTISTDNAMNGLSDIVAAPVMPWDALICTSSAARKVVETILEAEMDYQRWAGREVFRAGEPQLPVIPLGVHTKDYASSPDDRAAARARLDLQEDEVAFLFAGRLSFSGKAHPYPMLLGLQATAERSGKRIVLIQAGQFSHEEAGPYYRQAVQDYCPAVRSIFVDGADFAAYADSFAAADIFVSLADSIQETFGLTPVEAMAAGLPVIVTDWDGYKDTVRDGVDGFRIRTWQPAPGTGEHIARAYEAGVNGTELYQSRASSAVSVDLEQLIGCCVALSADPARRRAMGEAARARARAEYDWALIYRRYRELWAEQDAIRLRALADPDNRAWLERAPRAQAARPDPFEMFASYPSRYIELATVARLAPGADSAAYARLAASHGFGIWRAPVELISRMLAALEAGPLTIERLTAASGTSAPFVIELVGRLAKMNLVILELPTDK
jgi:glycosyltransferase involved in cell wall biosynthesis